MPITENPVAFEALRDNGYLTASGRVKRRDIAMDVAEKLRSDHEVKSVDELDKKAVTLDELTLAIFGVQDEDLRFLLANLTTPAHRGLVQGKILENGHVLASAPVQRKIGETEGKPVFRSFRARFISSDTEVLRTYVLNPMVEETERWALNRKGLLELVVRRVPALKSEADRAISEMTGRYTAALNR